MDSKILEGITRRPFVEWKCEARVYCGRRGVEPPHSRVIHEKVLLERNMASAISLYRGLNPELCRVPSCCFFAFKRTRLDRAIGWLFCNPAYCGEQTWFREAIREDMSRYVPVKVATHVANRKD